VHVPPLRGAAGLRARILDWAKAGFFRIAPLDDEYESTRRYLPGTNVLETTFRTPSGTLVLTDFFLFRVPAEGEGAHSAHPDHQLIRLARCTDGEVAVKVKLVPRFDYGLTTPRLETLADDLVVVYGGADGLVLQSELPFGDAERSASRATGRCKPARKRSSSSPTSFHMSSSRAG
jgi:alpha,alpha-trehalase